MWIGVFSSHHLGPPDGFDDLTLKFPARDIVQGVMPAFHADERILTATGTLLDGTPFEASDCVTIRGPKDRIASTPGDEPEEESEPEAGGVLNLLVTRNDKRWRIQYELPHAIDVAISVYDVSGRLVSRLSTGVETAGKHMVEWKTSGLPNGIYFLRLSAGRDAVTEKTVLVR